jgi:hypothetical protein
MAALILESLVLRGVAVLRDEPAVGLRLGASVKANPHAPGVGNSMRHPRPGYWRPDTPGQDTDVAFATSGILPGAGRSRRSSGSVGGTLRTAWGTTRWCPAGGGRAAAAAKLQAIPAGFVAPAIEAHAFAAGQRPATRTPPAAMRGLA